MLAIAASLLLAVDKDAPIVAIRPSPDHVIVQPVKPKISSDQAEWRWFVFSDRRWTKPEGMFFHDSEPLTKDSTEVIEYSMVLTASPGKAGLMKVALSERINYGICKVGEPVDVNKMSGGGQGISTSLPETKDLRSLMKVLVAKKKSFALPQRLELAETKFPKIEGSLRLVKKEGEQEIVGSSRSYDPQDPPRLTSKEQELLNQGYKLRIIGGMPIPNKVLFISVSK